MMTNEGVYECSLGTKRKNVLPGGLWSLVGASSKNQLLE